MANYNQWDLLLIVCVSIMGTAVAYLRNPEHKAFMLMLPVPFTLAMLSVNKPVDATNVLGMSVLFGFTFAVWLMHAKWRVPILLSIVVPTLGYCLIGGAIARLSLHGDLVFGVVVLLTFVGSVALVRWLPYWEEPHHSTPLPPWIKIPAIALVIFGLVSIKKFLGGFMTMFPMVGLVAAYECRHSLWTNVRRIPWILVIMVPMEVTIWVLQPYMSVRKALALSWPVYLAGLWVFHAISRKAFEAEAD